MGARNHACQIPMTLRPIEAVQRARSSRREGVADTLSMREKQVIALVSEAKPNKEIAHELNLTEGTIKEYLNRVFRKVGVKNRTELAIWAIRNPDLHLVRLTGLQSVNLISRQSTSPTPTGSST